MLEIKFYDLCPTKQLNVSKILHFSSFKVYTDGSNKFAMISFLNSFKEAISAITFKISQFNKEGKCLKREIKSFTDLCVRPKKTYTDENLIKVDAMVASFEVEIISIRFITIAYDNGSLSSACIKVDKRALRLENKRNKKRLKHPDKMAKKPIKEVKEYSFTRLFQSKGLIISMLVFAFFIIAIICISLIFTKNSINFLSTLFKGGLF